MNSDDYFDQVFSRERILGGGPPTKRAQTLLFQIEGRAAYLATEARQATALYLTDEAVQDQELAYFDAYYMGQEPPRAATIQDLEHFAPQWATLVPDNPNLRAALAYHLGKKYTFAAQSVPGIREFLGLDSVPVEDAYRRFYNEELDNIYAERTGLRDRLRWKWQRLAKVLDNLPPFWWVFSLTITEIVGASVLALPIALAGVGPLPGIVFLLIFGLINVLTVGYIAETASRSSGIRSGSAFLGQVVDDYLGRAASLTLSLGLLVLLVLVLLAFYIGFATTLAEPTRIPAQVWVLLLFVAGLFFVTRGSISSTVTSALVVGAINLGILVILTVLTVPHIKPEYLTYTNLPFVTGQPFDTAILALVFGVVYAAYFGHLSVPNSARMVLQRDPSGRSLIRGAMAAQVVVILVNSIWIFVVNGSLAPQTLAAETGTVLTPLAEEVGPIVLPFGTVLVILGMGMITIHFSLGLFNLTREWLPQREREPLSLPRRQGRVLFYPRREPTGLPQIALVYLGLREDRPLFRLDFQTEAGTGHVETVMNGIWDIATLFSRHPELKVYADDLELTIDVIQADARSARLRPDSSLDIKYEAGWDIAGLHMSDILTLPEKEGALLSRMVREGPVELDKAAEELGEPPQAALSILKRLITQGYVQELETDGLVRYEAIMAATRVQSLPEELMAAVAGETDEELTKTGTGQQEDPGSFLDDLLDRALSKRGRFLLGILPIVLVFLTAEMLLLTGSESFSGPLGFIGVIVIAMLGSIFPVLLLRSGRKKGEIVPQFIYQIIGNPLFLVFIYLISLTGVVLHGLVIWEEPVPRALALFISAVIVWVTVDAWRRGAFLPRLVVEVHLDQGAGSKASFTIAAGGKPMAATVRLIYDGEEQTQESSGGELPDFANLNAVTFDLPVGQAHKLKVWTYLLTPEREFQVLPAQAELRSGETTDSVDLSLSGGEMQWPLAEQSSQLTLSFQH